MKTKTNKTNGKTSKTQLVPQPDAVEFNKRREELAAFDDRIAEPCWVKGVSDHGAAAGTAIIDGKLSHVVMWIEEETQSREVSLGWAAKYMRQLLQTERDMRLNVEDCDQGQSEFLRMVEAAGSKN